MLTIRCIDCGSEYSATEHRNGNGQRYYLCASAPKSADCISHPLCGEPIWDLDDLPFDDEPAPTSPVKPKSKRRKPRKTAAA